MADIDIEVPDKFLSKIIPDIKKYLTFGPAKYRDKNFRTYGLAINYKGQIIEISRTDSENLYDSKRKIWIKSKIDLSKSLKKKVFGIIVSVIRKEDPIHCKETLLREVDKEDLKVLRTS